MASGLHPVVRRLCLVVAIPASVGCATPFSQAMNRGDEFARASMWNDAVQAYQEANRLDPTDPRAVVKLRHAKFELAENRMAQARLLLERQDFVQALRLAHEALSLVPDHLSFQQNLNAIIDAGLRRVSEMADQGEAAQALELANAVLAVVPHHGQARLVADRTRQAIAKQHSQNAQLFIEKQLLGNAALEWAACLAAVDSFPQARQQLAEAFRALRKQVTIHTEIVPPDNPGSEVVLTAQRLAQVIAPAMAIEFVGSTDPGSTLQLSASDVRMTYRRDRHTTVQSCDYVCGVDHRPNPEHGQAELAVAESERHLSTIEQERARIEVDVHDGQRQVDDAQLRVSQEESQLDRERHALEVCRARQPSASNSCGSEQSRVESQERRLRSERQKHESALRALVKHHPTNNLRTAAS
ncbi:MAG TPA: hypothetical protein PKL73_22655, partial [Polyangiaceae bacterium]|nr:hypothetical protein [Polyangiaceae bacterium]HNZ25519.1 hypothetical protein [Polyangiaceae bacterium]HOD25490.1 hypothetical protein [Polyangiaceae bacterium]HOE51717.1 hypothetical protein [Polyangiaceae bacterium]HOH03765.1 hypothetical protein [Polyangiaceae bacterium]